MKLISLSQNGKKKDKHFAKVDDEDYERVIKIRWHFHKGDRTNYARGYDSTTGRNVYMHRFILGITSPNITVDHKDHDGLNNQKNNIRSATLSQQGKNSSAWGISNYLGVTYDKKRKKWMAKIKVGSKSVFLGRFKEEEIAARAYDVAAIKHHGEFANPNFITDNID